MTRQKPKILVRITKNSLRLLRVLAAQGCISHYTISRSASSAKHHQTMVHASTLLYKGTPFFKSVRLVSTPTKRHIISLTALKVVAQSARSSTIILSTSKGVMTHREACKQRIGGLILGIIH